MDIIDELVRTFRACERRCANCRRFFCRESFLIHYSDRLGAVVQIRCAGCDHSLGIAVIGLVERSTSSPKLPSKKNRVPPGWTKRDVTRLANLPPITYDDVLDFHEFIEQQRFVPKFKKRA